MCGLTGIALRGQFEGDLEQVIAGMTEILRHRGPDSGGLWTNMQRTIGLGHRRLSIQDVSASGAQPMHSSSDRFVLVFNGEIYNFRSLRKDLADSGVVFRGQSDSEVLLEGIQKWGIRKALDQACGMFALAVFDKGRNELTLVRDRMGEKPLYYGLIDNHIVFASELKAFKAFPNFRPQLSLPATHSFFSRGFVATTESIYCGINKVPPAHTVTFHLNDPGSKPKLVRYWDMAQPQVHSEYEGTECSEATLKRLEDCLLQVVSEQLIADREIGAFLSGGIDSSLVVALMQRVASGPVRSFTIGFNEPGFNEAKFAKKVAAHLKTDHTELYVSPNDCLEFVDQLATKYCEPFADASQLPTLLVSRLARKHVVVSLTGDGGDESFAGYDRYYKALETWHKLTRLPLKSRSALASGLEFCTGEYFDTIVAPVLGALSPRRKQRSPSRMLSRAAETLRMDSLVQLYQRSLTVWEIPPLVEGAEMTCWSSRSISANTGLRSMIAEDYGEYLPDDILVKVDRATMSVGLESRAPLLDRRVVELAWSLDEQFLNKDGRGKYPLRRLLSSYVPTELFDRPKSGFAVPLGEWLKTELREWAEDLLSPEQLKSSGVIDVGVVREAWSRHTSGVWDNSRQIWCVLMFQQWCETNLANLGS